MAQNPGLTEITDKSILRELKYEYNRNKWSYRTTTPLISGSVVNRGPGYHLFERKLKMIRLSLFSLLSIIQCKNLVNEDSQIGSIKRGITKFLKCDVNEVLRRLDIDKSLKGWPMVINDMCLQNELTDSKSVNMPNLKSSYIER